MRIMISKIFSFLIVIFVLVVFLPRGVDADLGPKPTVDIDVLYNQKTVSSPTFQAKMLGCFEQEFIQSETKYEDDLIPQLNITEYDSLKKCYWHPARHAWGGECHDSSCHFEYFPPSEFKLAVFIPSLNKVFVTNEISRSNFNSHYEAELSSDGSAIISETTFFMFSTDKGSSFTKAFFITIILELLTSFIFIFSRKLSKKILVYVVIANILSLPIVWFLFPLMKLQLPRIIVLSEIFAVLFETYFIYLPNKQIISFKQSLTLSILNNLVSLFIGGFIGEFI